jgi:hypothetical protein
VSSWEYSAVVPPEDRENHKRKERDGEGEQVEFLPDARVSTNSESIEVEEQRTPNGKATEPAQKHMPIGFLARGRRQLRELGLRSACRFEIACAHDEAVVTESKRVTF